MNVWRIGSNWGTINVLDIFKKEKIAFAGVEVADSISQVQPGDIICVTNGKPIVAIGLVEELVPLDKINKDYAERFEYVTAIKVEDFYWQESFPEIDFSYYDGQGKQFHKAGDTYSRFIIKTFSNIMKAIELQNRIDLLKYKKQIILQGPPGTGKTRLAKIIADEISENWSNIKPEDVQGTLRPGLHVDTPTKYNTFEILKVYADKVIIKPKEAKNEYSIFYSDIINRLVTGSYKRNVSDSDSKGTGTYQVGLAMFIAENYKRENIKIIQFHPSYTYEDFVRGIVAKPNEGGDGVLYEAENKILGIFAKQAKENYENQFKDLGTYSLEIQSSEYYEKFKDHLEGLIEEKGGYFELTESVGLISSNDEDAFRYKGKNDGWLKDGNRMLHKDILQAYLDGNKERQDIKQNRKVSGLARQHASYFIRVLNLFRQFLTDNSLVIKDSQIEREPLRNYVLIIDEINRANLSSVLGELIYALEYRGEEVDSVYGVDSDNKLILPPNLYIIGTMNTADRSVGHIDYAIRRRFAFVDIIPMDLSGEEGIAFDSLLFNSVKSLFTTDDYTTRSKHISPDFEPKDVALGHSYFIDKSSEGGAISIRLEYEIKPILLEYIKDGILKESAREEIAKLGN